MSQPDELLACYQVLTLLEKASQNAEALLDTMPGFMVVLNRQLQVIRANKAFCDLCGVPLSSIVGFHFNRLFTEADAQHLQHSLHPLQEGHTLKPINLELTLQLPQQQPRSLYWQAVAMTKIKGVEGPLLCLTGKDLTQLYQSEAKLKNIFEALPIGVLVFDSSGVVKDILSQSTRTLFLRDQLIGLNLAALLRDLDLQQKNLFEEGIENFTQSFGRTKAFFDGLQASFPKEVVVTPAFSENPKWLHLKYQPIIKANRVDGCILFVEDVSQAIQVQIEAERVNILEKQVQAVYETAIRDPLTGLYTRLFMRDSLRSLLSAFNRNNIQQLSVVVLDVDHFKLVNDTHGHSIGDAVLAQLGAIITQTLRSGDVAIRYGGEEILLVIPQMAGEEQSAVQIAELLRKRFQETPFPLDSGKTFSVTFSAGVADCRRGEDLALAVERADGYLYQAKHLGRNRVCSEVKPSPAAS